MKLLNSLILLILTCMVSLGKTQQLISIGKYQFIGNCKPTDGSGSSASSFEASSDSPAICLQDDLLSGQVLKEGACIYFNTVPSTFSISPGGDSIIQSIFEDNSCQGNVIEEKEIDIDQCYVSCVDDYHGNTYSFSINSSLSYPSNTYAEISYSGDCNGDWKNNFNYLEYYIINKCNVAHEIDTVTFIVGCNSTDSWVNEFYESEVCTVSPSSTQAWPLGDNCGINQNFIELLITMSIFGNKSWVEITEEDEEIQSSPQLSSNRGDDNDDNIKILESLIISNDDTTNDSNSNINNNSNNKKPSPIKKNTMTPKTSIKSKYLASRLNKRSTIQIPIQKKTPTKSIAKEEEEEEEEEYEETNEDYGEDDDEDYNSEGRDYDEEYSEDQEDYEGDEEDSFHSPQKKRVNNNLNCNNNKINSYSNNRYVQQQQQHNNNNNNQTISSPQHRRTKEDIFFRKNLPQQQQEQPLYQQQQGKYTRGNHRDLINEEKKKNPQIHQQMKSPQHNKNNSGNHDSPQRNDRNGGHHSHNNNNSTPTKGDLRDFIENEKRKTPTSSPQQQQQQQQRQQQHHQDGEDIPSSLMSSRFARFNSPSSQSPPSPSPQQHKPQQRTDLSTPITKRRDIEELTPYSSPNPSTPVQRNNSNNRNSQNSPSVTPTRGPLKFNVDSPKQPIHFIPNNSNNNNNNNNNNNINKNVKLTNESIDLNNVKPIIGTCKDYEKPYLRLTGLADPAKIRPIDILETWFPKLIRKYQNNKNFNYALDQLKSIRQDLMVQHIRNKFTLNVYEANAKICLENSDFVEFGQCLSQIKELYHSISDQSCLDNKFEFISYDLLFNLIFLKDNELELISLLPNIINDENFYSNENIKHTFEIIKSVLENNYCKFNKLYLTCYNMEKYLLEKILNDRLRVYSVNAMIKSYKPSIHLNLLEKQLSFSNQDQLLKFLEINCPNNLIDKEKQELVCSIKKK
ncbi:hypothetical protein RB653_003260 [Dictyostelium firmibasis]|uniref:SAC3/GANP/THP3 conserved domain-containing protein n=1 Tax=Dictyostelium firmibasis TaxID=79012 RepID=A0AAN7TRV3_9MYCE